MPLSAEAQPDNYWFARHSKSIIFLISILTIVGLYEALSIPVAVFPTTNFPRIIIGVDNGVMPIEQMEVTITRPIEEAVRTVPGLEDVRSVTSRGSAEVNLFFNWNVNMLETLQLVDAAVSRVQSSASTHGPDPDAPPRFLEFPDHRLQPDVRHGAADRSLGAGDLRHQAAAQPLDRRGKRTRPGRPASRNSTSRSIPPGCSGREYRSPTSRPPSIART